MKEIDVFETVINSDMTEGRGPMKHLAFFMDYNDANRAGDPHKVMGVGTGHEVRERKLIIFENYGEYIREKDKEIFDGLMNKLSKEEKRILGLGDDNVQGNG